MSKFLLLILLSFPVLLNAQKVYINEVMASNDTITDNFDEFDDYIELYNGEDQAQSLEGWFISDKEDNPMKFTFAAGVSIPAKGFLILWADEDQEQGTDHINFKISKDGESVFLSKPSGTTSAIVDQVLVPALEKNATYSRTTDGGDTWAIRKPTYNATNFYVVLGAETNLSEVKLFPSLVTDQLTLQNAKGEFYQIINVQGIVMEQGYILTSSKTIDASKLSHGLNIIQVGNKSYKVIRK